MLHKPQEVLDLVGVMSAEQGAEDLDIGKEERRAVCGAGGASTGWVEGGSILGGGPWEVESFPTIGGKAQQAVMGAQADGGSSWVSCLLSHPRHALGIGIKFSRALAFDHGGLSLQAGGGSNSSVDGMGGGALPGKGGLRRSMGGEGGIGAGAEHLGASGDRVSTRGMGLAEVSDAVEGVAHSGGRGSGNGAREWFTGGRAGGSMAEGGLAGQ
ncbi:hypothetical protein E4T56_gene12895 [Termitomyces sp. T112]|nr:hypothetical protein E4T56_gene12895 [Termitomyces sp. T112]